MSKRALIAICEDDELVRDAVNALVTSLGFKTALFVSAEQFLYSGLVGTTACLISDMQMPGMSGAELYGALRARGYLIPTIFVTADCCDALRERLLGAGAIDVLPKPFDKDVFLLSVERALGGRRAACNG
jgi:FixJ family two-component response regulator